MRHWNIYVGIASFLLLFPSVVDPRRDELGVDIQEAPGAEEFEASGRKSSVEHHEETTELLSASSNKFLAEESCQTTDCPPFEDDDDESDLQLLSEPEGVTDSKEEMPPVETCNPDATCSEMLSNKESEQESTGNVAVNVDASINGDGKELKNEGENSADPEGADEGAVFENIPLREILLKLKPEGLIDDDEEDSNSDYTTTDGLVGEEQELEGEALVSSGSLEKQAENTSNSSGSYSVTVGGGVSSGNTNAGNKKAACSEVNGTEIIQNVEIINATMLMKLLQGDPNITSRTLAGPCFLIYFFSPYCPFSVMGSAYVNALARSVPNIPVYGLDSIQHHGVNARYGVMGTPTLLLFHNGNGIGRYNASVYSVNHLISFINHYTDQEINAVNVTSSDFEANLPSSLAEGRPYALWAAWIFLLSCASWLFLTSELCARLTEAILNNWREAEAQHDHQD